MRNLYISEANKRIILMGALDALINLTEFYEKTYPDGTVKEFIEYMRTHGEEIFNESKLHF